MPARPLLAALVACALAACTGSDAADQVVGGEPAPTTSTTAAPDPTAGTGDATPGTGDRGAAVPELLDFEASAVDGSTVDVAGFAGSDLVVWFWAPW